VSRGFGTINLQEMNWIELKELDQLQKIKHESTQQPVLIFKHSSRCNISRTSLDRLERKWNTVEMAHVKPYFLDLLSFREISNHLADLFSVEHESPQILVISDGKAILDLSHFQIDYDQIRNAVKN
jgi:bacillithiol system protein YtxJ